MYRQHLLSVMRNHDARLTNRIHGKPSLCQVVRLVQDGMISPCRSKSNPASSIPELDGLRFIAINSPNYLTLSFFWKQMNAENADKNFFSPVFLKNPRSSGALKGCR
jgi:hypothetical protein